MTKPCETCTKTFIDEGVERKRDYPLERECVECLKGENERLKDYILHAASDGGYMPCPHEHGFDDRHNQENCANNAHYVEKTCGNCDDLISPKICQPCIREALNENIGD